jgi:anti-anti-sigma factor
MTMEVDVERLATHVVVHVEGDVDLETAPQLQAVLGAFEPGSGPVIVDLGDVAFLDSSGLSVLVRCHQQLDADGVSGLRLVITRPALRRVLDATGLTDVFDVYASLDDAARGR